MASEIRVNKIENRSGLGTVTFADTGVDLAGIVTATTFSGSGASLTALPSAQLSGALPAISAASLTNVPAANVVGVHTSLTVTNATTTGTAVVGGGVTISESGIEASGIGITVASINQGHIGGRRNFLINGAMQIYQRGSTTASPAYGIDRWWQVHGASTTMAQDSTVPSGEGFSYSMKLSNVSGDVSIGQPIELTSAGKQTGFPVGKKITFSFYAKCDSGTDGVSVYAMFRQGKYDSTNQVNFTGTAAGVTLTTTWTRHVVTMTIPTCHSGSTMVAFEVGGISGTSYFTGFQAEIGDQATPFEHRSFAEEILLCQRYFAVLKPNTNYAAYGNGCCYSTYQATFIVHLPTEMRTSPTFAYTGSLSNFYDISGNSSSFQSMNLTQRMASNRIMQMVVNTSSNAATAAKVFMLGTSGTENTDMTFDAEF